MEKRPLGRTGLAVTKICLGSMTWGEQNTEAEGHAQMDRAFERGVKLTRECQQALRQAEQRVQQLVEREDGSLEAQPFNPPEDNGEQG